jgi:aldose sugar dehydrogenase
MHNGCFACHGELGYGGAGPSFRGDKLLMADQYVITQILIGRGIMPSFADRLNDDQIAAVATYLRYSWGNNYGAVTPARVAEIRKSVLSGDLAHSYQ